MPAPLRSDVELVFALQHALEGLETDVNLVEVLGTYPAKGDSQHPVINFVFANSTTAVIESTILRLSEAVEVLDRTAIALGRPSLFQGRGRARAPVDSALDLLVRLRHQRIAHHVRLEAHAQATFTEMTGAFGSTYAFLRAAIGRIRTEIDAQDAGGLYDGFDTLSATSRVRAPFELNDVDELVRTANAIMTRRRGD